MLVAFIGVDDEVKAGRGVDALAGHRATIIVFCGYAIFTASKKISEKDRHQLVKRIVSYPAFQLVWPSRTVFEQNGFCRQNWPN